MEYYEIKKEILEINNELGSIVSVKDHDYTHQPSNQEIKNTIVETIIKLRKLKRAI